MSLIIDKKYIINTQKNIFLLNKKGDNNLCYVYQ